MRQGYGSYGVCKSEEASVNLVVEIGETLKKASQKYRG